MLFTEFREQKAGKRNKDTVCRVAFQMRVLSVHQTMNIQRNAATNDQINVNVAFLFNIEGLLMAFVLQSHEKWISNCLSESDVCLRSHLNWKSMRVSCGSGRDWIARSTSHRCTTSTLLVYATHAIWASDSIVRYILNCTSLRTN